MGADHYFYRRIREVVLPNAVRLMRAARAPGIEVVYTIIESLTKDGRDRSLDHKLSNIHLPKGHPDARVIEDIAPAEDDIVLPKTSSGVFNSTNIDYVLRNLGVRSLIVPGCLTDQCVDMAVRDAHRDQQTRSLVGALLAARPDLVLVEMGLPFWHPPEGTSYLATYGASRASAHAAAELLGLA